MANEVRREVEGESQTPQDETSSQADGHGATEQHGPGAKEGTGSDTGRGSADVDGREQDGGGRQLDDQQHEGREGTDAPPRPGVEADLEVAGEAG